MFSLGQVAEATGGTLMGDAECGLTSVSTDTRDLQEGALFVALAGDRFDAHDFLDKALASGAAALLVSNADALPRVGSAGSPARAVVVPDTLKALQELSLWHRRRMEAQVTALTGSAGKTTTKELVAAIFARMAPSLVTRGNLNNHIGVPLTLFRLSREHRYAVIEMGCSGFGEIALLARLARPRVGLITNVGSAHLEGLGDLDGVSRAKGELFAALPPEGTAVVNLDDPRVRDLPSPAQRRLGFGSGSDAEVQLRERRIADGGRQELTIRLGDQGEIRPSLGLLGEHNARNAVAAAALAWAVGAAPSAIEAGLSSAEPAPGRLRLRTGRDDLQIIDDTYNANPDSTTAALVVLKEHLQAGRKVHALLGEMLELGPESEAEHERVGRFAAGVGLSSLVCVGESASAIGRGAAAEGMVGDGSVIDAATPEAGAELILGRAAPGDVILVKGSRGAHMELAVDLLCAAQDAHNKGVA